MKITKYRQHWNKSARAFFQHFLSIFVCIFRAFFEHFSSILLYLHGGDDGLLGPLHRNLPGAESQARHSGSIVQLKVGFLLQKRTTFIKIIQECTVCNEQEAPARHFGSIVQLKVRPCCIGGRHLSRVYSNVQRITRKAQARHSGSIVQLKVGLLLHKRTTFIRSIKECTVYNKHEVPGAAFGLRCSEPEL